MTTQTHALAAIAVAAALAILGASNATAADEHSAPQGRPQASTSMLRFYGGSSAQIGKFEGKLVCLRCDLKPSPGTMKQCEKEGHRHALAMESDSMIHPLLGGTDWTLRQINSGELHGKQIVVHGKYYPDTGVIFVDNIAEHGSGANR